MGMKGRHYLTRRYKPVISNKKTTKKKLKKRFDKHIVNNLKNFNSVNFSTSKKTNLYKNNNKKAHKLSKLDLQICFTEKNKFDNLKHLSDKRKRSSLTKLSNKNIYKLFVYNNSYISI